MYFNIQKGLKTKDENHFKEIKNHLLLLTKNQKCPRKIKMIINEFLRRKNEFQAYLIYPSLNLPRTTNTIESYGKKIRRFSRYLKTPQSLKRWLIAFINFNPYINCYEINFSPN